MGGGGGEDGGGGKLLKSCACIQCLIWGMQVIMIKFK